MVAMGSHAASSHGGGVSALEPARSTVFGSRSCSSFADWMRIPVTHVTPTEGLTMKPEGLMGSGRRESKFRYLVVLPSIALATPSEPGPFDDDAMIGSPG